MERTEALQRRVAELKAEVARKDAVIASLTGCAPRPAARLSIELPVADSPASMYTVTLAALKNASKAVEHECQKHVVCNKLFAPESKERADLVAELTAALTRFCAIAEGTASCQLVSSLRVLVVRRSQAVLNAALAVMHNASDKGPQLCGMVEKACQSIETLPVSSKGAVKRLLLEHAAVLVDTSREFTELLAAAAPERANIGVDGGMNDDDDDDHWADDVDDEARLRIQAALDALVAGKRLALAWGAALPEDDGALEPCAALIDALSASATDFAAELYPVHDTSALIGKATAFAQAARALAAVLGKDDDDAVCARLGEFCDALGLVVA